VPKRLPTTLGFKRYALDFDGTDDYVEVPFSSSLDFGGMTELTVEMLCLLRSKGAERYTGRHIQFLIGYDNQDDSWAWWLHIGGAWVGLRGLEKTFTPKTGEWVHLCGVYDGSEMRMYVNGELDRSKAQTGGLDDADTMIAVGRRGTQDLNYWDGFIALVRIYTRPLTLEEIRRNMLEYHNPVRDGLVLWLHDSIVGDTWHDESGCGNDGVIHGAVRKELAMWEVRAELGL